MSMTPGRPSKKNSPEDEKDINKNKDKAMDIVSSDSYLDGPSQSSRFNIDLRLKKQLRMLSMIGINQDGKTPRVTERMLVTEAIVDLLKKYEAGNGQYDLDDEFTFKP